MGLEKLLERVLKAGIWYCAQILPMNDEPPQLGQDLRGALSCKEGGQVQVTVDYLSATDHDSDNFRLTYMLARSPGRGELQRAGLSVDRFSQQDLLQGYIYYVHSGETKPQKMILKLWSIKTHWTLPVDIWCSGAEVGPDLTLDTITLIISDGEAGVMDGCCHGDAPPPPVPLHGTLPVYDLNVTILPVNNKVPAIILGNVLRSGPFIESESALLTRFVQTNKKFDSG